MNAGLGNAVNHQTFPPDRSKEADRLDILYDFRFGSVGLLRDVPWLLLRLD